jgi:hypothetical protein
MLNEEDKCLSRGGIKSGRELRQQAGDTSVAAAWQPPSVGLSDDW